ncbi:hypothetical protein GY45DRAFT_1325831 [Cubamyces sp. BRFM 1775]|nr:hypothetical protein GY45DRAFT_1325831 [Cubamyces sp. BRFM 1775]
MIYALVHQRCPSAGRLTWCNTLISPRQTAKLYTHPVSPGLTALSNQDTRKMNILRLPQELLICILLNVDPSDLLACGSVCSGLNKLLNTSAVRHRMLLAKVGMRHDIPGKLPLMDSIKALQEYRAAWHALPPMVDSLPHAAQNDGHQYPKSCGDAFALLNGTTLWLIRPPCFIRNIKPRTWSIDLSISQLDVQCCGVDSSQGLLVISGVDASSPEPVQCHLISLSGTSLQTYHPEAAVHAFTITPACRGYYAYSCKTIIHGDLIGWAWRDYSDGLRVYNWKTGALLWQCHSARSAIHFAFLDETRLIVACDDALRIYAIDPHTTVDPTPHTALLCYPTLAEYPPPVFTLELPPLIEDSVSNALILESRRPVPDDDAAFGREANLTVLAMLINAHSTTTFQVEMYLYVIPVSTLLTRLNSALAENTSHAVPPYPTSVPWDSWGASGGCLSHIPKPGCCMTPGLSVMGSMCAVWASRVDDPATVEAFVFDFHAHAHPESTDNDDREILAHFMDGSRVVRSAKLLRDPIRNTLPYRVVHKTIAYNDDPDFAAAVTRHSFTLLEDGLAVMSTTMEEDMWRLRLFAVDKPI